MKLALLSDLHGYLKIDVPKADAILIAGDIAPDFAGHPYRPIAQAEWILGVFYPWVESFGVDVVWTWGNHDFVGIADGLMETLERRQPKNSRLLVDQTAVLGDDIYVYGTPWSPRYAGWAFMKDEDGLRQAYAKIPGSTDILISHAPPFGAVDKSEDGTRCGSPALADRLKALSVKLVVCGHIHEAAGMKIMQDRNGRPFPVINASVRDARYHVVRDGLEVEFDS